MAPHQKNLRRHHSDRQYLSISCIYTYQYKQTRFSDAYNSVQLELHAQSTHLQEC